jgi:flagellar hook-associated protein 2
MIDQLITIDSQRIKIVEGKKNAYQSELSEWQTFNTKLLSLKNAACNLKSPDDFLSFSTHMASDSATVKASDLISVSTSASAAVGTYSIVVTHTASAQRLSSNTFATVSDSLGSSFEGNILINGTAVTISAVDSLSDIRDRINAINSGSNPTGVTASIVNYSAGDYRLALTSDTTGAGGISLSNGCASDILQSLGFTDSSRTAKHHITGGDKSDTFESSVVAVKTLLGLSTAQTSEESGIVINGSGIAAIDLSTDSLSTIASKFNDAGIDASVIRETTDGEIAYRLFIEGGSNTYIDENNILETLGILCGGVSDVMGIEGDVRNTAAGEAITPETLIREIDGYSGYESGDYVYLNGTKTDGTTTGLPDINFIISDTTTAGDLLETIENLFGDVTASITGNGAIRITDNGFGASTLAVQLAIKNADGSEEATLIFDSDGDFGTAASLRARQVVPGSDASIIIDGVTVSDPENTITDAIAGVTIDLSKADADTTISLNITRDIHTVTSKINNFVNSYNTVMTYINSQQSYDSENRKTGGVLFGDGTLSSVKTDLTAAVLQTVWGVCSELSILGLAGINVDENGMLSVDSDILTGYLETNFNDIKLLFAANGTAEGLDLEYVSCTDKSAAGEYPVRIDQAATRACRTGTIDLSGGLSENITLFLTESGNSAAVPLTAGMNIEEIVDAINTEMNTAQIETLVGAVPLFEGPGQSSSITAQTTWDKIYVGANPANLENSDEILFHGTNRSGQAVSGSYTITDVSSDTVQGLLSAIESAFSGTVRASVDTEGRIVITDIYEGTSRLSLDFDYTDAHQLTFGSVDATPEAGDGSCEGRWSLPVTASDNGYGYLVLTHNYYGSSLGFAVSQSGASNFHRISLSDTALTTSSSAGRIYAEESTAWDELYGSTIGEGDTIMITGTTHDGSEVGPSSYCIYEGGVCKDIASLLNAIEAAFASAGGSIEAGIDMGKIVVEDMEAGESEFSVTLICNNEGEEADLNLGAFNETAERDLTLGLTSGTVNGLDTAGRINGQIADGSGQVLKGSEPDISEGICVKYTGSVSGLDAGSVSLTTGVAELFDRVLKNITDPLDGYLAFKKDSLGERIDSSDDQIDRMTELLNRKMEQMIDRFVAMELILSQIQNQSNWLSNQISASFKGWNW